MTPNTPPPAGNQCRHCTEPCQGCDEQLYSAASGPIADPGGGPEVSDPDPAWLYDFAGRPAEPLQHWTESDVREKPGGGYELSDAAVAEIMRVSFAVVAGRGAPDGPA